MPGPVISRPCAILRKNAQKDHSNVIEGCFGFAAALRKSPCRPRYRPVSSVAVESSSSIHPIIEPGLRQRVWTSRNVPPHQHPKLDHSLVGMTSGDIFKELLARYDVDTVFGYPGGVVLPIFDAIYISDNAPNLILPRHEQGAGHMAQGYSRATGKPGVVLVTSGSGATNLITPLMDALADGTPMVAFCGQEPSYAAGLDSSQEADVLSMTQPCTKWNISVREISDLPRRIDEAFKIATSGRPGPVLVELSKDVTDGVLRMPVPKIRVPLRAGPPRSQTRLDKAISQVRQTALEESIKSAARLINQSRMPILYVGQGILASPEGPRLLKELANKADIPVTTSLQGLGAFDEMDPKALHMLGLHGSGYANMAIQYADTIIALGARFDDRVTGSVPKFAPAARQAAIEGTGGIIHFDISPKNINKVVETSIAVEGDCAENLTLLLPLIKHAERPGWLSKVQAWKAKYPFQALEKGRGAISGRIQPQKLIEKLSDLVDPIKNRTIITTGVGQHQMWAAQHFRWRHPRTMVTSGGLGTMGFGLPAAIGAKVGRPDALVIDIDGDASFNMTLSELLTARQFDLDIKVIILNNEEQGMVTHLQTVYFQNRFAHSIQKNPDFVETARAMGIQASKCEDASDADQQLQWLLGTSGPAVLEVMISPKALTLPMVPAGRGLHEFVTYNDFES